MPVRRRQLAVASRVARGRRPGPAHERRPARTHPSCRLPALVARLLLAALLVLPACGDDGGVPADTGAGRPVPGEPGPTVLLVTFDTTRADHVGAYGHAAATTPRLDALAAEGLLFERTWTATPITLPSHTSILTGTYPCAHGVRDNTVFRAGADSVLVSEVLAENGWRTGGFVGAFVLDARFGLDQGFDVYTGPDQDRLLAKISERPASEVVDDALAWLATVPADAPAFAWVHFYDPHHPYVPPAPWDTLLDDPYDGEIAYADAQLGRLLDGLPGAGRSGRQLVVVTSDHGDALGDHGEPTHGFFVYESTMRVPLVVAGDGVPAARVTAGVSVTDVAPTILDWAGLPPDALADAAGRSLLATSRDAVERPLYLETLLPHYSYGWYPSRAIVADGWKYVASRQPELYELGSDPGETNDRMAAEIDRGRALASELARLLTEHPSLGTGRQDELSDAEREQLAALGYVAGTTDGDPFAEDQPDTRDRIHTLDMYDRALDLITLGRQLLRLDPDPPPFEGLDEDARRARAAESFAEAKALLGELLALSPESGSYLGNLGLAHLSSGDPAGAIPYFERAAILGIDPIVSHYNLGTSYAGAGETEWAREEMQKVLSLDPHFAQAYDWLARHHEQLGETGRAAFWRREQRRVFDGPPEQGAWLLGELRRLTGLAQADGQPIAGPDDFPTDDLAPAGR